MTRAPAQAYFMAIVCALLLGLSLGSACGQSQRQDTLRASVVSVNAARDAFTHWDLDHQKAILARATTRDEYQTKIAEYRSLQHKIETGFTVAYRALALAATQTDELSLSAGVKAAGDLVAAVKDLIQGAP